MYMQVGHVYWALFAFLSFLFIFFLFSNRIEKQTQTHIIEALSIAVLGCKIERKNYHQRHQRIHTHTHNTLNLKNWKLFYERNLRFSKTIFQVKFWQIPLLVTEPFRIYNTKYKIDILKCSFHSPGIYENLCIRNLTNYRRYSLLCFYTWCKTEAVRDLAMSAARVKKWMSGIWSMYKHSKDVKHL